MMNLWKIKKLGLLMPGLLFALLGLLCSRPAAAQTPVTLDTEHVDLTFNYVSGAWSLQAQDKTNGVFYNPGAAVLQVNSGAQVETPDDPDYAFLGTSAGDPVWVLPFDRDPSLLYLGTNVEGTATGTFSSYDATTASGGRVSGTAPWIKVQLVSVSGPTGSYFSTWTNDPFGAPTVWMATSNGISSGDAFWIYEGSHIHFNWAFTKAGTYYVTFQASGYIGGVLNTSGTVTWQFNVLP